VPAFEVPWTASITTTPDDVSVRAIHVSRRPRF